LLARDGAAKSGFYPNDPVVIDGEDAAVADAEVARIDAEYDRERIKALIANDGWA